MANANAVCNSFKRELLVGTHNFTLTTGDVFKLALYVAAATYGASTTVYSATNEVAAGGGYSTGGNTLTNVTPTLDTSTGITDFQDSTWTTSTITARGAMIYNSSKANAAVVTLDFGSDKISSAGDFVVQFPAPAAATAIIRIA
jgi:hypothetical protein